ncbi:MAG: T9SS type A sorting domain-containing protein [bacterium]
MKAKILILFVILVGTHCNVSLQAQEPLPDTVWTKTFQNPITINCVKFSPDGQYIFAGTNNIILQIETSTGNIFRTLQWHDWKVFNIDFSPTGDTILSSGADYTIRLWDYISGDTIHSLKYERPDSLDIQLGEIAYITPDGKRIISLTNCYGDNYDNVYVFDISSKELIGRAGNYYGANKLNISLIGKYFAIVGYPTMVALYDLNTYQLIKVLGSHESQVNDIAFSPDGKMVASCGEDWRIYVWDTETRELIHEFGMDGAVVSVKFSNDNKFLITGGGGFENLHTSVFNLTIDEIHYNYPIPYGRQSMDISSANNFLVVGGGYDLFLLNPKWDITGLQETNKYETIIYPNPVDMKVNIDFNVINPGLFNIELLNITGNFIENIFSGFLEPGNQTIQFNCKNIANGTYFIRITSPSFTKTIKLVKES